MIIRREPNRQTDRVASLHIRHAIAIQTQQVAENARAETDELVRLFKEFRRNESSRH